MEGGFCIGGWIGMWMDGVYEWMECMNETKTWKYGEWKNKWIGELQAFVNVKINWMKGWKEWIVNECMEEWVSEWVSEWMNEMNEWMDKRKRTFVKWRKTNHINLNLKDETGEQKTNILIKGQDKTTWHTISLLRDGKISLKDDSKLLP